MSSLTDRADARYNKHTTAEILVDRLLDWGVETIFGLPGDGINGIMEALRVRQDRIRFIHVRHEESAAFMACAYATSSAFQPTSQTERSYS